MSNTYNILNHKQIKIRNINIGKVEKYKSSQLIPIYYYDKKLSKNKYDAFIFKTPKLFINKKYESTNDYYNKTVLEVLSINKEEEEDVSDFYKLLSKIEKSIKKTVIDKIDNIMTKYKLNLKDKKYCKLVKLDKKLNYKKKYKNNIFYLPTTTKTTKLLDINNKFIKDNKFDCPTYAYFSILIRNIWIKGDKWGINIFATSGLILPSQISNLPEIQNEDIIYLFQSEIETIKKKEQDAQKLQPYLKMKKMGVPVQAIKNKMLIAGLSLQTISDFENSHNGSVINRSVGIPPPPPPPPPLQLQSMSLTSTSSKNDFKVKINPMDLRNVKLKKFNNKNNKKATIIKKKDGRVPSLQEIQLALKKLKLKSKKNKITNI